jgi:hypothetical protein
MIASLGARVHLCVRPCARERFTNLFRDVLECDVREIDFGLPQPIVLISLPDGSAVSAEFSEFALEEPREPVTAQNCSRGAWIEFRTAGVARVQQRLDDAGIASFRVAASPHRYFSAPGGQVFRVIDLEYRGP